MGGGRALSGLREGVGKREIRGEVYFSYSRRVFRCWVLL